MQLTEGQVLEKIHTWLEECDADELARITGEIFGGNCTSYFDPEDNDLCPVSRYNFEPNENYYGAFD